MNVFAPDGLVARKVSGNWRYYQFDPQGSVTHRLTSDETVTNSSMYNAYGQHVTVPFAVSDPFGYNGRWGYYTDSNTGLILCTFRYYDPAQGRWLNRDPIGYAGGVNVYGYCGGQPVGSVDAGGARWGRVIGGVIGGVAGGLVGAMLGGAGAVGGAAAGTALGSFLGSLFDGESVANATQNAVFDGGVVLATGVLFCAIGKVASGFKGLRNTTSERGAPFPDYANAPPGSQVTGNGKGHIMGRNGGRLRPDPDHPPPIGPHWDFWPPGTSNFGPGERAGSSQATSLGRPRDSR